MAVADSKYRQLVEVLDPKEAERVLAFVDTAEASPRSCLRLAPDASKAHRTKVYMMTFDPTPPSLPSNRTNDDL